MAKSSKNLPDIADVIAEHLDGEKRDGALAFAEWLRSYELGPAQPHNRWQSVEFMSAKPKLEDGAAESITGERLERLLKFATWLRANRFSPAWASWNTYKINIKGQMVCNIALGCGGVDQKWLTDRWRLSFYHRVFNEDNQLLADAEKEIIWSNVKPCNDCGGGCCPGYRTTICGRELDGVCGGVEFWNPGEAEIGVAKKLLLMKREYEGRVR